MKKIGKTGRDWLRGFHLFFTAAWIGAAMSMLAVMFLKGDARDGGELYGYHASVKLIDDFIIIASAFGCFITGLLLSWLTNWGFFKYRWIIFKLIVTVAAIVFGTFWLGPWTNSLAAISGAMGQAAFGDKEYLSALQLGMVFGSVQMVVLVATIFISTLKPWGRRK
jgi:uncharacterized membrane protein